MEIKCPDCGGQLQYWKEYLSQKTQLISLDGKLNKNVTTSKPEAMDELQGFECIKCGWVFNNVQDVETEMKYPHFEKWLDEHISEINV